MPKDQTPPDFDVSIADDYAYLKGGDIEAYFGDERIGCLKHKDCDVDSCEFSERVFSVKHKGVEVFLFPETQISEDTLTPYEFLLLGLAAWLANSKVHKEKKK
jgi:hypothetical protein